MTIKDLLVGCKISGLFFKVQYFSVSFYVLPSLPPPVIRIPKCVLSDEE